MWHWLRSVVLKTQMRRLAVLSFSLHMILLAALFLSGSDSETQSLDLGKVYDPQAKIVLLPFYKVVPAELNKRSGRGGSGGGSGSSKAGTVCQHGSRYVAPAKPATTLVHLGPTMAEKRAAAKKRLAEKKRIAKEKAEKKAKLLKKQQERKRKLEEKRARIKEAARKKEELKQQRLAEKQAAFEQAALEKAKLEKATLEQADSKKNEENVPAKDQPVLPGKVLSSPDSTQATGNGTGDGSGEENIIYVGRDEIDQYRESTEFYQALAEVWHPPVGIEPEKPCVIEVAVDTNGGVQRVTLQESSGIIVYDSAAQAALYEVTFPERQYGKVLHITFR